MSVRHQTLSSGWAGTLSVHSTVASMPRVDGKDHKGNEKPTGPSCHTKVMTDT